MPLTFDANGNPKWEDTPADHYDTQQGDSWGTQSTRKKIEDPTTDWTQAHSEAMAPLYNAAQKEFESTVNWQHLTDTLKAEAQKRGLQYDPSDLMDIQRHAGYDASHLGDAGLYNNALQRGFEHALQKYDNRTIYDPTGDAEYYKPGGEGYKQGLKMPPQYGVTGSGGGTGISGWNYDGGQFSDPWNKQLEDLLSGQLGKLTNPGPNDPQSLLSDYLLRMFQQLSTANGYTPEEQAILNTQAFEPIEAMRKAANQNVLQRAGARGILPSSGLVQDEQATNDRFHNQLRTVANRDLAVNQINRQNQQRQQALQMIQGLTNQEQGVNDKAVSLATLLRQLPIDSMNNSLNVINGTGAPSGLMSQVSNMVAQSQRQRQNAMNAWLQALGYGLDTFFG